MRFHKKNLINDNISDVADPMIYNPKYITPKGSVERLRYITNNQFVSFNYSLFRKMISLSGRHQ